MCTVSWLHEENGYNLLCNRDEKKTRSEALIPRVRTWHSVRYVAPQDGDFGGTWIATNEFGLTLALLNGANRGLPVKRRSRGQLVLELICQAFVSEVQSAIRCASLNEFAPFSLIAIEPDRPATLFEWDGGGLSVLPNAESRMPLTSSSFDPEGVRHARQHEFKQIVRGSKSVNTDLLLAFHQSHGLTASAYSTCMHRPDAHTVSFTWVNVGETGVEFFYSPSSPCAWEPGTTIHLGRVAINATTVS